MTAFLYFFFLHDTSTTEIYTLSYTTLFRSRSIQEMEEVRYAKSLQDLDDHVRFVKNEWKNLVRDVCRKGAIWEDKDARSEEHTSELQSRPHLVCRLLLEKKKKIYACKSNRF